MRLLNTLMQPLVTLLLTSIFALSMYSVHSTVRKGDTMDKLTWGAFSVSLAVKDINASLAFYEKLDFKKVGGNIDQNWIILQNETTTIGLFQGMFDDNILTFNPGWNHNQQTLDEFQDVRDLQAALAAKGIQPVTKADPATSGPASFVIADPDGNMILVDQHVDRPSGE